MSWIISFGAELLLLPLSRVISQGRLKCPAPKIYTHTQTCSSFAVLYIIQLCVCVCVFVEIKLIRWYWTIGWCCCWLACVNILPAGFERAMQDLEEWRRLGMMEMYTIAYYNKVAVCCILTLVDPDNYIYTHTHTEQLMMFCRIERNIAKKSCI